MYAFPSIQHSRSQIFRTSDSAISGFVFCAASATKALYGNPEALQILNSLLISALDIPYSEYPSCRVLIFVTSFRYPVSSEKSDYASISAQMSGYCSKSSFVIASPPLIYRCRSPPWTETGQGHSCSRFRP